MKAAIILTLLLGLVLGIMGQEKCNSECPQAYKPLCAALEQSNGQAMQCTFPNECVLDAVKCVRGQEWTVTDEEGACNSYNPGCSVLL